VSNDLGTKSSSFLLNLFFSAVFKSMFIKSFIYLVNKTNSMRKEVLWFLTFIFLVPFVNAQNTLTEILSYALGVNTESSFLVLAFGMFVIMTAVINKLANKFFTESRNLALIVSIAISLIAINFMPQDLYTFFAKYVVLIVVLAVILAPWILVDWFGRIPRRARHFVLLVIYAVGFAIIWKLSQYPSFSSILESEFPFFIFDSISFKQVSYLALGIASAVSIWNMKNTTNELQERERLAQTRAETRERMANARLSEIRARRESPGLLTRTWRRFGGRPSNP